VQTAITYLHTFAQILIYLLILAVLLRVLASWFVRDYHGTPVEFLVDVTEPILGPLRRIMPPWFGVDFSPMITILVLFAVGQFLAT
jgi:YggT family protein